MITRFRVEISEPTKEAAIDSATLAVSKMISAAAPDQLGEWECTQDVVARDREGFHARMVMLFHPNGGNG